MFCGRNQTSKTIASIPSDTRRDSSFAAGAALALTGSGAILVAISDAIGFVRPGTETLYTLLWIAGAVLLVWGLVLAAVLAVGLIRRAASGARVPVLPSVLILAAAAIIVAVLLTHPLTGGAEALG